MLARGAGLALAALTTAAAYAAGAAPGQDPALPATLERVTGPKAVAFVFFFVLAALAVLVIFRGIRAR